MPCGWGGNRRSGVALVMRHRLRWFIHLQAHDLRKRDEHPAYTPRGYGTLYIYLLSCRSHWSLRTGVQFSSVQFVRVLCTNRKVSVVGRFDTVYTQWIGINSPEGSTRLV